MLNYEKATNVLSKIAVATLILLKPVSFILVVCLFCLVAGVTKLFFLMASEKSLLDETRSE